MCDFFSNFAVIIISIMKRILLISAMLFLSMMCFAQEDQKIKVEQDSQSDVEIYKIEYVQSIGFVTLNASYNNYGKPSFGLTYGVMKRFGWYASVMTNFNFKGLSTDYSCDSKFFVGDDYPMYTGKDNYTSLSAMGGFVYYLNMFFSVRAGVGFGARVLSYELLDKKYVKNTAESAVGVDLSAGAMFRFKKLMLSLDCVTTNFKYYEARLGVGLNYKK